MRGTKLGLVLWGTALAIGFAPAAGLAQGDWGSSSTARATPTPRQSTSGNDWGGGSTTYKPATGNDWGGGSARPTPTPYKPTTSGNDWGGSARPTPTPYKPTGNDWGGGSTGNTGDWGNGSRPTPTPYKPTGNDWGGGSTGNTGDWGNGGRRDDWGATRTTAQNYYKSNDWGNASTYYERYYSSRSDWGDEPGYYEARANLASSYMYRGIQRYKAGMNGGSYSSLPYRDAIDLLLKAEYYMVRERFTSYRTYEQYRSGLFRGSSYSSYGDELIAAQRWMADSAPTILLYFGSDANERRWNVLRKLNVIHFYLGQCYFELATRWSRSSSQFGWGTVNDAELAETYLNVFVTGFENYRYTFQQSPWTSLYREQLSMYAEALYSLAMLEFSSGNAGQGYVLLRRARSAYDEARRQGCNGIVFYMGDFLRSRTAPSSYDFGSTRTNDWSVDRRIGDIDRRLDEQKRQSDWGATPGYGGLNGGGGERRDW